MLSKLRAGCLIAVVTALMFTATPPAHATSTLDITFTATMVTSCGFGFPVITGSTVPFLPGPTCGFALTSDLCTAQEASTKKVDPAPTGGTCTFVGGGVMTGYCGLSQASGTLTLTYTPLLGNTHQTFRLDFIWTELGVAIVTGTMAKASTPQTGPFLGEATLFGPTPILTPAGGSCFTETAAVFTLVGQGNAVMLF